VFELEGVSDLEVRLRTLLLHVEDEDRLAAPVAAELDSSVAELCVLCLVREEVDVDLRGLLEVIHLEQMVSTSAAKDGCWHSGLLLP
jgi:hypothetical protein